MNDMPEKFYLKLSDDFYAIRMWATDYFDGSTLYLRSDKMQGSFFAGDRPSEGNFMALYADGSGGSLFKACNTFNPELSSYIDAQDGTEFTEFDWFVGAGYSIWVRVPDDFKLFFERD